VIGLKAFGQIHCYFYWRELIDAKSLVQGLRLIATYTDHHVKMIRRLLQSPWEVDSIQLETDGSKEFTCIFRIYDTKAVLCFRNEPPASKGWSCWPDYESMSSSSRCEILGQATLLECEGRRPDAGEIQMRAALQKAVNQSPGYASLKVGNSVLLRHGRLFEAEMREPVWPIVHETGRQEENAEFIAHHWLRLVRFLHRHAFCGRLFELRANHLEDDLLGRLSQDRGLIASALRECDLTRDNLKAALLGFENTLGDIGFASLSVDLADQNFLVRLWQQMRVSTESASQRLREIRIQAGDRRMTIPGGFWWSPIEEATVARYVDCTSGSVQNALASVQNQRRRRGNYQSLGADTDVESVTRDIYEWLSRKRILYDLEPIAPHRQVQRIRRHMEALKEGTCLDLACLFAALLEGAHKRPVLVHYLGEAHMACGLWMGRHSGFRTGDPVCRSVSEFRAAVQEGELMMIECMGFTRGKSNGVELSFERAKEQGKADAFVARQFNFAVDVGTCRHPDFDIQATEQEF